jgi:small conductance mechanosensitive channel
LAVIKDVVCTNPRVLADPAPLVQISTLADFAVQIAVKPWVAVTDYGSVGGELNLSIVEALRQRGIDIPFPQQEVRLLGAA